MPFHTSSPQEFGIASAQERLWRSLYFYATYRLILGGVFLFLLYPFSHELWLGGNDSPQFFWTSVTYFFIALISLIVVRAHLPRFTWQLANLVSVDIVCITLLADASGGISSGLSVLMLVSLASAGLVSRGRITLLYAALASIAVLLQQAYAVLTRNVAPELFMPAGLLCVAYFAVTWLAHVLAKFATQNEQLALSRGVELSIMAEANRLLIQDLPDGVLVVNEHGLIRQSNPSAARLLGVEPDSSLERMLTKLSPELAKLHSAWRLDPRPLHTTLELPSTRSALGVRFLPVQRDGFWGAVIVLEDILRIQEQAQQFKLAALGRLTASIAHEVRNPLSSISYAAELLREEKRTESRDRMLQLILSNVARLNRMVHDIMQLNRRDRLHQECFDLREQLPGLTNEIIQPSGLPKKTIKLTLESPLPVCFDRGHLEQVLWNLCGNALRHCRQQSSSVTLRGWCENSHTVLEVSDDGSGISAEAVPHLFEPFFTTEASGTGLGLYISRELCEANGSRLEYRVQEGSGACFRITFGETNEQ